MGSVNWSKSDHGGKLGIQSSFMVDSIIMLINLKVKTYFQLEMLKSRLLTMFQIFCDSDCPCIIMNTNLKHIDLSISAYKSFNRMLYGVQRDMSHMNPPAFSSIALS